MKGVVMRAAIIAMSLLLLPAALLAAPTLGVYFTYEANQIYYSPTLYEEFDGYVYAHGAEDCWITAIEFSITLPTNEYDEALIDYMGAEFPAGTTYLGDPTAEGLAIAYWPPMSPTPGYAYMCTLHFGANDDCDGTGGLGGMYEKNIVIVATPLGHLYGTCWPENNKIDYIGLTSVLCPGEVATKDSSWGAIKSLF
jgi:hypothetical protein